MTDFPPSAASTDAVLHSVHITWKPGIDDAHATRVASALNTYAATVPGLLFFRAGSDLGLRENTADFGIVALFDNSQSYRAYAVDDPHVAIITDLIEPATQTRSSTQTALTP
ncbi:Dabb family protein [Mycobacterium sp. URHB0021]|jgi:stress responsive alpha/beta barrel protein